jgi:hypothetical protein
MPMYFLITTGFENVGTLLVMKLQNNRLISSDKIHSPSSFSSLLLLALVIRLTL